MIKAKLTSKGQITIPIDIRRLLSIKAGDHVAFNFNEHGLIIDKSTRPQTIQERFANYDINRSNKELNDQMEVIATVDTVGEEVL